MVPNYFKIYRECLVLKPLGLQVIFCAYTGQIGLSQVSRIYQTFIAINDITNCCVKNKYIPSLWT